MSFRIRSVLTILALLLVVISAQAKPETLNRAEIEDQYKWNLNDIYPDWDAWEADIVLCQEMMARYVEFQGTLNSGPDNLLRFSVLDDSIGQVGRKLSAYPGLMFTVEMSNNELQAKSQKIGLMFAQFGKETAWDIPELISIPKDTMVAWIDRTPDLEPYRFNFMELYRNQEHVLDEESEQILSYFGPFGGTPATIYSMLSTADVKFPEVTLSNGETMKATHGNYELSRFAFRNQDDREAMFKAHFSTYDDFANTYAAIYNGTLQRMWGYAQARHFDSSEQMALDGNAIPVEVMENLINTAKNGSAPLIRYNELRQEVLGLEQYRYFDAYLPLIDVDFTITYEDVKPMIIESVKPFGKEYQATVERSFNERWFDVYEADGKSAGAFSSGIYGVHPYMLLNYGDTLEDATTLAHEMGHTMHTVLAQGNQPYATSGYTLFVAEVASTMNEALFFDYAIEHEKDAKKRVMMLQYQIDRIAQTFYRQAMFADFELKAHRAAQAGTPITADVLQNLYLESLHDYFGDSLDDQEWYKNTWARISHFNRPFYVYQYATCLASSSLIHQKMIEGKKKDRKKMVQDYLELLKSGGNDHPIEQLKKAGVDWTTAAPAEAMVAKMDMLVDQLTSELKKLGMIEG